MSIWSMLARSSFLMCLPSRNLALHGRERKGACDDAYVTHDLRRSYGTLLSHALETCRTQPCCVGGLGLSADRHHWWVHDALPMLSAAHMLNSVFPIAAIGCHLIKLPSTHKLMEYRRFYVLCCQPSSRSSFTKNM